MVSTKLQYRLFFYYLFVETRMEEDEDKDTDLLKQKVEKTQSSKYMSVPKCFLFREMGYKQKSNRVPCEFQLAAEDKLIAREHEEFVSIVLFTNLVIVRNFMFLSIGLRLIKFANGFFVMEHCL